MEIYTLALFVTSSSSTSILAERNLRLICAQHLRQRHTLSIVDVIQNPDQAETHRILATPTLVKLAPAPVRHILGDLSDTLKVLMALGLAVSPTPIVIQEHPNVGLT